MIGKLKSLVGSVQNRFTRPPPPAKPAGMPIADAFVAGDRSAKLRAEGRRMLEGAPERPVTQELPPASVNPGAGPGSLDEGRLDVQGAFPVAAKHSDPADDVSAKADPEWWSDDPMVQSPGMKDVKI